MSQYQAALTVPTYVSIGRMRHLPRVSQELVSQSNHVNKKPSPPRRSRNLLPSFIVTTARSKRNSLQKHQQDNGMGTRTATG
jgi:hypothetical protein